MTSKVVIKGLSKSFGPVHALRAVDLDVDAGEVVALLGENGAGKSTLLKILSGDYATDAGTIEIDGRPVVFRGSPDSKRAGIRVIAQEPEILKHLSVAENIFLGNLPVKNGLYIKSYVEQRAAEELARYGFDQVISPETMGSDLSPAQRQIVEIMRGLITSPRIVAFDEPTSSLTEHEVTALFRLIRQLRDDGVAVIYVSHRMHEIFDVADRAAVLRDGQMVGVRDLADTSENELVKLMVGRELSEMFSRSRVEPGEVVLQVDGLVNEYVHDVSLSVRGGEVVVIAGLIGAGRSELARTIVGDLSRTAGTVAVDGIEVKAQTPRASMKAGIGFAPEERKAQALLLQRSVRDNTSLAILDRLTRMLFVRASEERKVVLGIVERMNVRTPSIEQEISKLSGGNQQKVVLGRWLARKPKVLILDEPTRGVDVGAKAEIYAVIDELASTGIAVLVISSELPEVLGLADRILVMQGGRIRGELLRADATEEAILSLALPISESVEESHR